MVDLVIRGDTVVTPQGVGAFDILVKGETIAAMTPCMRLYAFLGQALAAGPVAPVYSEWVKTYADPDFEALAARLEELLDRHAMDGAAVRGNYRRAMELEHGFFDANL